MRTAKRTTPIVALAVMLPILSGCLWAPGLEAVRKEIERQMPSAHFEKEFAISLGPVSLGLTRMIVGLVPDAAEARPYLKHIRSVQVAVYNVDTNTRDVKLKIPSKLKSLLEEEDWELVVKTTEQDESTWVLYRVKDETVTDLYVVTFDGEELVMVVASGRLDRVLEKALNDHIDLSEDLGVDIH
jgi:hypothetical protein